MLHLIVLLSGGSIASPFGRGGGEADGEGNIHALSPAIAGALPKGEPLVCAPRKFVVFS